MTERRRLADARAVADRVVALLWDGCSRIEIAGSIRRGVPEVKDIEIVCVPRHQPDLFGGEGFDLLNETIRLRVREKKLQWRKTKGGFGAPEPDKLEGRKFYMLGSDGSEPWAIDLFAVRPPAQWGAIMAIRTGPAEYAKRLVTSAHRQQRKCEDGRLVSLAAHTIGQAIETPEERDFIEACGMQFAPPNMRR